MYAKTATLFFAIAGTLLNAAVAAHLLALWRALRAFDSDSEYEGTEKYTLDAIRLIWWLLSVYYSVAAVACAVGILGVVRRIPSYVRLFRDYSFADLCLCAFSTVAFTLASFRPAVRSSICEELSRHPDLLRDLAEAGLNLENCESWFERAVVALVGLMGVLLVIRLQFTLTISNYHAHLVNSRLNTLRLSVVRPSTSSPIDSESQPHRIYLLPNRPDHTSPNSTKSHSHPHTSSNLSSHPSNVVVYAPVSLDSDDARELDATEAWVAVPPRQHSRHHHSSRTGRISLPVRPDEGLLPTYEKQG